MAAKRGRPACRDGTHEAPLHATEMAGVGVPKSFAVAAEYIRHLQGHRHGGGSINQVARPLVAAGPVDLACC